jgi:DNA-binding protein Fis
MTDRDDWRPLSLEEVRKQHIPCVLGRCKGNRLRASQVLGIGRTSLYRYLKQDGYDEGTMKVRSAANGH